MHADQLNCGSHKFGHGRLPIQDGLNWLVSRSISAHWPHVVLYMSFCWFIGCVLGQVCEAEANFN